MSNMTNAKDKPTEWLTITEAAKRLGVSGKTVWRWIDDGLFPGTIRLSPQPKSEFRIPLAAIERFEESRKVK
jgi:excisionase family DNA binding protein